MALSADGQTALLGAPYASSGNGAAYVYSEAGGTWPATASASFTGSSGERIGWSVALSADGQAALVGAPWASSINGAAYVFSEVGDTWPTTPAASFASSSEEALGFSVAFSADGQTALVGAPYLGIPDYNGAAYLYSAPGTGWSTTPATTFTGRSRGELGWSVALSADGQAALVAAPYINGENGAAYLYSESGGTWSTAATFTGSSGEFFGASVALSADGQTALVGATFAGTDGAGAAYIYSEAGGTWPATPSATFSGSSAEHLGGSVALSADGQTALVGATWAGIDDAGAAYLYNAPGGSWTANPSPTATFTVSSTVYLGWSVALSADGQTALVGAPYLAGNAYVFTTGATTTTVTVDVSGSQTYGSSSPIFSYTDEPPSGLTVSGTLTCTTVDGGTPIGASLDADSYTLDGSSCSGLSLSGTDSSAYSISYTGVTDGFTVGQASQSISFSAPASGTVGGQATLSATGGASGNPVVFSLDTTSGAGVCGVSGTNGTTVDYTAPGSCVIDANQEGNTDYSAALEVEGTVLVVAAPVVTAPLSSQTISFTAPASGTVGSSVTLSATGGGSGNPVVFSTDASSGAGVCRVSGTDGTTLSYSAVGDCVVDANQAGNAYYFSAPQLTETIVVVAAPKAGQTIKFVLLVKRRSLAQPPLTVHASASSGLAVSFSTSTRSVCTAKQARGGAVVTLHRPGTCTVVASQAGNASYAPAPPVSHSFTVSTAAQTIKFAPPPNRAQAGSTISVSASASSGLKVSFTTTTPSVCTLAQTRAGARLTLLRAGKCTVVAHQAGNATYSAAEPVGRSFTVSARLTT